MSAFEVILLLLLALLVSSVWRIAAAAELVRDRLFEAVEMIAGRVPSRLPGLWQG
jgi:hypothetical protein